LADVVRDALPGERATVSVDEAPDPSGYDLVAVGFWVQAGRPDLKATAYLSRIGRQRVFLFATHGAATASPHARSAMDHAMNLVGEARVVGIFSCQGEVPSDIMSRISPLAGPSTWMAQARGAVGHPDEEDRARLRRLLAEVLTQQRFEK
jgi:hypothetical protein